MGKYQGYDKYKDSGVEWLGDIPDHWEVKKFSWIAPIITCGLASTPEYIDESEGIPFLSAQNVKNHQLIFDKYNFISQELHQNLTRYKKPERGDILVTRVGACIGDACIIETDLEFSIYVSLTHIRVNSNLVVNKYIVYFFESEYCKFLNLKGTIKGGGVGNLNVKNVQKYMIPIPPLDEQEKIARFLDYKTKQIDKLIAKKETLIEKLDEKRTSLISHAVTKGIDVNVPMKDSGIEWVGEIPKHWEISKAKFVSRIFVPQRNKPDLNLDDGFSWLTMDDMLSDTVTTTTFKVTKEAAQNAGSKVLKKGSVVASCVGNFGVCAVINVDVIINQQLQPTFRTPWCHNR